MMKLTKLEISTRFLLLDLNTVVWIHKGLATVFIMYPKRNVYLLWFAGRTGFKNVILPLFQTTTIVYTITSFNSPSMFATVD